MRSALLLVLAAATACYKWEAVPVPAPQAATPWSDDHRLEILKADQGVLKWDMVQVVGDSLVGRPAGSSGDTLQALALRDLSGIRVRKMDGAKTGVLLGVGGLLVALSYASRDWNTIWSPTPTP